MNRKNTHSLVTSTHSHIEFKSFPGIMERYLLVFVNVPFYKTGSISPFQECYEARDMTSRVKNIIPTSIADSVVFRMEAWVKQEAHKADTWNS
jgi:hypothetical protein